MESSGIDPIYLQKLHGEFYNSKFNPVLSDRQKISLEGFMRLNRERDYYQIGEEVKPHYIKEAVIRSDFENRVYGLTIETYITMIQSLDDVFVEYYTTKR